MKGTKTSIAATSRSSRRVRGLERRRAAGGEGHKLTNQPLSSCVARLPRSLTCHVAGRELRRGRDKQKFVTPTGPGDRKLSRPFLQELEGEIPPGYSSQGERGISLTPVSSLPQQSGKLTEGVPADVFSDTSLQSQGVFVHADARLESKHIGPGSRGRPCRRVTLA